MSVLLIKSRNYTVLIKSGSYRREDILVRRKNIFFNTLSERVFIGLEAAEKSKILEYVILNELKNLSIYAEERCFANAQHDRHGMMVF